MDATFRLLSTIGVDLDQYERDLKSAEVKTRQSAKALEDALSDIDIRFDLKTSQGQIKLLQKEAQGLGVSVRKYLSLGFGEGVSLEAQKAAKTLESLGEARKKALSGGQSSGPSEGLLKQLDQLRIGAEQLSRGSLGGLPNLIKGYAISANAGAVASGALSTKALILGTVAGVAAAAVVGAGVAMVKMANDASASAVALQKLQDETGLSADRLQYFQAAAKLTNVELSSITSAFGKYQQAAHEANNGNKEMAAVFTALGQTTKNVSEITFEQFIKKLSDITDESTRTETAQKVLGSSARDLQRFYAKLNAEGGRVKDILRDQAKIMSGEALQAALDYAQAANQLSLAWDGFANTIGSKVLPSLAALLQGITETLNGQRQLQGANFAGGAPIFVNGRNISQGVQPRGDDAYRDADKDIFPYGQPPVAAITKQGKGSRLSNKLDGIFHPADKGKKGSTGASDANAAQNALLALQKTQNEVFLKLEQDRLKRELESLDQSFQNQQRFANDSLGALNQYYDDRIKLQQDSISAEIENEQKYYLTLQGEQDKAKKQSEKLRLQAEKERVKEKLALLNRDFSTVGDKENGDREKKRIERDNVKVEGAINILKANAQFDSELKSLTGTDFDKFLVGLEQTAGRLREIANVDLSTNLANLAKIDQFKALETRKFQLGQGENILNAQLDLGRTQVARQGDLGNLTEGQQRKKILEIETRIGEQLRENLQQQIAIAEANGEQLKALQLRRELEEAQLLGVDQEKIRRFKAMREDIGNAIDDTRQAIINGQVGILDGLRDLAKNISNQFFNELERTLIERATGGKFSSIGEVLADQVSKVFGKILGKASGAKKDPVTDAVEKQTDALASILHEQVQQSQQSLAQLSEMANCACQAASQPSTESFGKSVLKGAISGAISGLIGGLSSGGGGGGGETLGPSLASNPNYISSVGSHGVPLFIKRARGGRFSAFDNMIVGEEGPEIIVPERGGNVIPNPDVNRASGGGGGMVVHQNFVIQSSDGTFSRKSQQQVALAASQGLSRAHKRGR